MPSAFSTHLPRSSRTRMGALRDQNGNIMPTNNVTPGGPDGLSGAHNWSAFDSAFSKPAPITKTATPTPTGPGLVSGLTTKPTAPAITAAPGNVRPPVTGVTNPPPMTNDGRHPASAFSIPPTQVFSKPQPGGIKLTGNKAADDAAVKQGFQDRLDYAKSGTESAAAHDARENSAFEARWNTPFDQKTQAKVNAGQVAKVPGGTIQNNTNATPGIHDDIQRQIAQKYPTIGTAGHADNKAFFDAWNTASKIHPDSHPMAVADAMMSRRTAASGAPATAAPVVASTPAAAAPAATQGIKPITLQPTGNPAPLAKKSAFSIDPPDYFGAY